MELKIYDKTNILRLTASPNSSSSVTEEIGGECSVSASFTHTEYVPLDVDDYAFATRKNHLIVRNKKTHKLMNTA